MISISEELFLNFEARVSLEGGGEHLSGMAEIRTIALIVLLFTLF
jgi:hypothetical protein